MNIKQITVHGLFNTFHHEIKFSSENIRIIIGENGVGKTTVLKILDSIFNKDYQTLLSIVFDSIIIHFSTNEEVWTITKESNEKKDTIRIKNSNSIDDDQLINFSKRHLDIPKRFLRINKDEWIDRRLDTVITRNEIMEKYGVEVADKYDFDMENTITNEKKWYTKKINENRIRLIRAQRLFQQKYEGRRGYEYQETASLFAQNLVDLLKKNDTEFSIVSQKLDQTFANRLLKALNKKKNNIDISKLLERLHFLTEYRNRLREVGIISQGDDEVIQNLEQIDDNILKVLSLYVEDNTQKLECYKDTADKLNILLNILNRRFKHKKIIIDKTQGFIVASNSPLSKAINDNKGVSVDKLSSGEQNELIMFYDLLFNCDSKDLVLIDEPEISLHLKWQQSLIDDFRNICDNNKLSLVIATHSPDIIGDNWSLVQTLSGQE